MKLFSLFFILIDDNKNLFIILFHIVLFTSKFFKFGTVVFQFVYGFYIVLNFILIKSFLVLKVFERSSQVILINQAFLVEKYQPYYKG